MVGIQHWAEFALKRKRAIEATEGGIGDKALAKSSARFKGVRAVCKSRGIGDLNAVCSVAGVANGDTTVGKRTGNADGGQSALRQIARSGAHELQTGLINHGGAENCRLGSLHGILRFRLSIPLRR